MAYAKNVAGKNNADETVRPQKLEDFTGQDELRANLRVFINSALERRKPLDHVLFYGSPGLGKTTLARIIANELGVKLVCTSGPVLERSGDLVAILTSLGRHDILFIDEIHRMPINVEEVLYPALEDFRVDIITGQKPRLRSIQMDLQPFTLAGATTKMGLISSPLRDRFGILARLDFYNPADLASIVKRAAKILRIRINEGGALEIGRRSRGTPRIANRLLRRVHDFALVHGDGTITENEAADALSRMDVDKEGLDQMDRKLLEIIIKYYNGGPVGLKTLSAACSEDARAIEDIYEPFLIQSGFLKRTPRGRVATVKAYSHLHIQCKYSRENDPGLF